MAVDTDGSYSGATPQCNYKSPTQHWCFDKGDFPASLHTTLETIWVLFVMGLYSKADTGRYFHTCTGSLNIYHQNIFFSNPAACFAQRPTNSPLSKSDCQYECKQCCQILKKRQMDVIGKQGRIRGKHFGESWTINHTSGFSLGVRWQNKGRCLLVAANCIATQAGRTFIYTVKN